MVSANRLDEWTVWGFPGTIAILHVFVFLSARKAARNRNEWVVSHVVSQYLCFSA